MLDRRSLLTRTSAALVAAPALVDAGSERGQSAPPTLPTRTGIDRDRAAFIMRQAGIDALVLERAHNLHYASGVRPAMPRLGIEGTAFAIVPRDAAMPIRFVSQQFPFYYTAADAGLAPGVEPVLVTGDAGKAAADAFMFAAVTDEAFTAREAKRRARTLAAAPFHRTMTAALGVALGTLALRRGRLGYDSLLAMQALARAAPQARLRSAQVVIEHIRLIKTDHEVAMMRAASGANVAAALATAAQMRSLGTLSAIRNHFNAEAARRGNQPGFLVLNGAIDEAYDEPIAEGQSVLIDAVSSRQGYHGDFGRTVFIGEPRAAMKRKVALMGRAWDELRGTLKPGLRFSEIRSQGQVILQRLGGTFPIPFNPHCVGLAHTENPMENLDGSPADLALQPGMIISVDCPLLESGQGGTAHLEDLTLITAQGSEPIHDIGQQVVLA